MINTDPFGERTYVRVNHKTQSVVITSRIAVVSELGVDEARYAATTLSEAIHRFWNMGGGGWRIRDKKSTLEDYTITFEPDIVYMDAKVLKNNQKLFADYDIVQHKGESRIYTDAAPNVFVSNDPLYSINVDHDIFGWPDDCPKRPVNPRMDKPHTTYHSSKSDIWDYGHEYGHTLGLIDRYRNWKDLGTIEGLQNEAAGIRIENPNDLHGAFRIMGSQVDQATGADSRDISEVLWLINFPVDWQGLRINAPPKGAAPSKVFEVTESDLQLSPSFKQTLPKRDGYRLLVP